MLRQVAIHTQERCQTMCLAHRQRLRNHGLASEAALQGSRIATIDPGPGC
jgi:hypothetical protein